MARIPLTGVRPEKSPDSRSKVADQMQTDNLIMTLINQGYSPEEARKQVDAKVAEIEGKSQEKAGTISEIINSVMKQKSISQGDITKMLNMKSQSGVSQALKRDMRISMILRFLEVLDGTLVVKVGEDEYKVTKEV